MSSRWRSRAAGPSLGGGHVPAHVHGRPRAHPRQTRGRQEARRAAPGRLPHRARARHPGGPRALPGLGAHQWRGPQARRIVTTFGLDASAPEEAPERSWSRSRASGRSGGRPSCARGRSRRRSETRWSSCGARLEPRARGAHRAAVRAPAAAPAPPALDVHGVGFKTADRIAATLGVAPDSPTRMEAGIFAGSARHDRGRSRLDAAGRARRGGAQLPWASEPTVT